MKNFSKQQSPYESHPNTPPLSKLSDLEQRKIRLWGTKGYEYCRFNPGKRLHNYDQAVYDDKRDCFFENPKALAMFEKELRYDKRILGFQKERATKAKASKLNRNYRKSVKTSVAVQA